jgi:methionyl-tRNA formyltransferase
MTTRADAGDIVDQMAVPILIDDTAVDVMKKVTVAAEIVLIRSLPGLLSRQASRLPQRILPGEYFGRRSPEDGRIDWSWPAARIHNLVRAVAPPYPGAFGFIEGRRCEILRTQLIRGRTESERRPRMFHEHGECFIGCSDGGVLRLLAAAYDGETLDLGALANVLLSGPRFL